MDIIRNGTLGSKLGAPKLLKAIDVVPDVSMDLSVLVEAYMPGNVNCKKKFNLFFVRII